MAAKIPKTGWLWASFDWARSPFYFVVVIYVFAPFFAQHLVGDPVRGQALFGVAVTTAGVVMAIIAPFLGGVMDQGGAKKPVLAGLMIVLALSSALLGLAVPGASSAVPLAMTFLVIAGCAYSVSELFHNALLPVAGIRTEIPLISGLGLSAGSAASVLVLLAMLLASKAPPFGLTPSDVARLSGPVCALWMGLFIIPFLRWMPDLAGAAGTWREVRILPERWQPFAHGRALFAQYPAVMRLLVARMIFMDGLTALFSIAGVYVAGMLGWNRAETAALGISATIAAVAGGFLGGWLDRRFGSRNAILIELCAITAIFIFQVGISPDALLFGAIPIDAATNDAAMFAGAADRAYLYAAIPISAFIVAAYSSCRSLLVTLSPPDQIGRFFGLYAMTSTVTVWVGPGLVTLVTVLSGSQRAGFGSLILLFVIGCILMMRVPSTQNNA
ncbi:hypothetical protein ASE75_02915 [Sphingomonas sp. Leaf17]|uniref:MFS transporter n=1 Tax=Sphingomonas sp. Leaf17 TaxID=1735683 RepID=UPI0006FB0B59|nr:MFS transporter [Sphingomonas sp. Leaf17]KQM67853.1 hypothetical protein ASE75_02915 [Sphingomonas sp. Leaf17]